MADSRQQLVEIGYVARAHGVRGELRIVTHDPESTAFDEVGSVHIGGKSFTVEGVRPTSGAWLVSVVGVSDRDSARELRGKPVEVERDGLDLDEGDVLLAELVGCRAVLTTGELWGEIAAVEVGVQDRLVVHHDGVEKLLPLVDEFVLDVDLDSGVVVVSPPEGLPHSPIRRS